MKVSVFVDSEFIHGKNWNVAKCRIKSNRDFWWKKIESNIERDRIVNNELRKFPWKVLRFWIKVLRKNLEFCVELIEKAYQ